MLHLDTADSSLGVDSWVDGGTCRHTFWSGGKPCVLTPYFFGGRNFRTNAHDFHWMIVAIFVEFSQLILMKIIKLLPPDARF